MGNVVASYVFAPPKPTYDETYPHQVTYLTTKSKKMIPCYFMKSAKKTNTTIIYSHGNAADIGAMVGFYNRIGVDSFSNSMTSLFFSEII